MSTEESHIIVDCEQSLLSYVLNPTDPPSFTDVRLKDPALVRLLLHLYQRSGLPSIIVTSCPHTELLTQQLAQIIPKKAFSVIYAPPLPGIEEMEIGYFQGTAATLAPPPGYNVLIDHTQSPEGGWEKHVQRLAQRLFNTGLFYDTRKKNDPIQKQAAFYKKNYSPTYFPMPSPITLLMTQDIEQKRSPLRSNSPLSRS